MLTPLNTYQIALYSQPILQSDDLLDLLTMANAQGITEDTEGWRLDQWLGLAIHLLITTQSTQTQQPLTQLLPKFGSQAISPLVKILHIAQGHLQKRAWQSLMGFGRYSLVIGLIPLLKAHNTLHPVIRQILSELNTDTDDPIVFSLARLLTAEEWKTLNLQYLVDSFDPFTGTTKTEDICDNTCQTNCQIDTVMDEPLKLSHQGKKAVGGDNPPRHRTLYYEYNDIPDSFVGWLTSASHMS